MTTLVVTKAIGLKCTFLSACRVEAHLLLICIDEEEREAVEAMEALASSNAVMLYAIVWLTCLLLLPH